MWRSHSALGAYIGDNLQDEDDMEAGPDLSVPLDELVVSVVDVETTGLYPGGHDRIIEIAVVRAKAGGEIIDEFETLINPNRDLGPTHIHGIMAADVQLAPSFSDVAGDIIEQLQGTIAVGHNIRFDLAFLNSEFERLGFRLPEIPSICTLRLGPILGVKVPARSLRECCKFFGVSHHAAHSALGDARAAAGLYSLLIEHAISSGVLTLSDIDLDLTMPALDDWPNISVTGRRYARKQASDPTTQTLSYLSKLVSRLPATSESDMQFIEYLELLDRALEDRIVTDEEAEGLHRVAEEFGLGRDKVIEVHRSYLNALAVVALEDGIVTDAERRDLIAVANALSINQATLDEMLEIARTVTSNVVATEGSTDSHELSGLSVCLTGTSRCYISGELITRARAFALAEEAGLDVQKGVTKNLDLLVLADPHSMSGKAKKAREYGVRTMSEEVFWRIIGVDID